jgi:hypothetical protein
MELKTASRISSKNVTEEELINAFQDDAGRGDFIILSQSEEVFIQAAEEGNTLYQLEYRQGDADHHFQCTQDVSKANVQSAFMKYLKGDDSWKTDFEWKPLEDKPSGNKPWWKFW